MKWTNRGHELDELGREHISVRNLYIWGAGKNGADCLKFLIWLEIDKDFCIIFVDKNPEKCEENYCGYPVIQPDAFLEMDIKDSILLISISDNPTQVLSRAHSKKWSGKTYFWKTSGNCRDNFIQNFLCIYLMFKYGMLLSHWTDYNVTTRCNLNCKGCLNFNDYICDPVDKTFGEFKTHIDNLFSKYDYLYSLHFSGGEPFLNKELKLFLRYLKDNYGSRIYDLFIITNGTVVPDKTLIEALKYSGAWVFIDDYTASIPKEKANLPEVKSALESCDIRVEASAADYWYDLDIDNNLTGSLSDIELEKHRASCNLYLQGFMDSKIYSCCYQEFAEVAKVAASSDNDFICIEKSSKMEILEFRQGYTKKGYLDFCKRCRGLGQYAKYISPAVQIPKRG